jgi:hypothetical protein
MFASVSRLLITETLQQRDNNFSDDEMKNDDI